MDVVWDDAHVDLHVLLGPAWQDILQTELGADMPPRHAGIMMSPAMLPHETLACTLSEKMHSFSTPPFMNHGHMTIDTGKQLWAGWP